MTTSRKLLLVLVLVSAACELSFAATINNKTREWDDEEDDCYYDWNEEEWKNCGGLSTGAIVGIAIACLIIVFGIPICLCFFCAWCCFKGCQKSSSKGQVVVAAPIVQQQQSYAANYGTNQPYPAAGATNAGFNGTQSYYPAPYPVQQGPGSAPYPVANGVGIAPYPETNGPPGSAPYPVQNYADSHIYEQPPAYNVVQTDAQKPPPMGWATTN